MQLCVACSRALAMIANFEQLQEMSNRQRPSAVKRWLDSRGIPYELDADGRPVTTESILTKVILRGRKTEPDFAAMRK